MRPPKPEDHVGSCRLTRGRQLPGVEHTARQGSVDDHLVVTHERVADRTPLDPDIPAQDTVHDGTPPHRAARFDRHVRSDCRIEQRNTVGDIHGRTNRAPGPGSGAPGTAVFQQVAVGLEQRVPLAAIIPARRFRHAQLAPLIHHVLERVREIELAAFARRPPHDLCDPFEQHTPVADEIESDIREPGDGRVGLLDDPRHVALRIRDDHPEAAVVIDLLCPDHAVGFARADERQISLDQGVHEHDEYRAVNVRPREVDRPGGAVQRLLLDESRRHVVLLDDVLLHDVLQVSGDHDQLVEVEPAKRLHHVVHHGPARDADERLRNALGKGQEPGPLPRQGEDDLHLHPPVAVLEPYDIVDLRGRRLEQVARHDRLELMDLLGVDVERLALNERTFDQSLPLLKPQDNLAPQDVDRFVLLIVVLEAEDVARLDVQDLSHVTIGPRPDELVAPGLFYAVRELAHAMSLSSSDAGLVTHAVTHTPHPTHPSGWITGRPPWSSASARSPTGQTRAHTPHGTPWNAMQRSGSSVSAPI